ncbi:MAG: ribonuclease H [Microthrixaceae bacterium]
MGVGLRRRTWAAGFEPDTTNQRMELTAVIRACERFAGPLLIVSDSTYVVNCWRDGWWRGWLKRDWRNSKREPVANRDLWERLVPHFAEREDLRLEWVKGHSGDHLNELADRLAVGAVQRRSDASGQGEPPDEVLGVEPGRATGGAPSGEATAGPPDTDASTGSRSRRRRASDPRVPEGHLVVVTGGRDRDLEGDAVVAELERILGAKAQMTPELVVLTGLRAGAETAASEAAARAGLDQIVVLPYPDPTAGWPERESAEFQQRLERASAVVTLERKRPGDLAARRASIGRRDGWLRSVADEAVLVVGPEDAGAVIAKWESSLGEDLWVLEAPPGR